MLRDHFPVGRWTYGEPCVHFPKSAQLRIGAFCSIAADVHIFLGGNHSTRLLTTYPFTAIWPSAAKYPAPPDSKGDVVIGNDVWICDGATILSGVTIGNGAVIGARAVVAADVPPYTIVAGNPAQVVRQRFSDEEIATLQRLCWWDWTDEEIAAAMPHLLAGDVAALAARCR